MMVVIKRWVKWWEYEEPPPPDFIIQLMITHLVQVEQQF